MIPFPEIHYHPEYRQLAAIVGKAKLSQEHWDEWARIQERYGWRRLIKAADRCEPLNRWPANIESVCAALAAEQIAEEKAAKLRAEIESRPKPTDNAARAAQFQDIRTKYGV